MLLSKVKGFRLMLSLTKMRDIDDSANHRWGSIGSGCGYHSQKIGSSSDHFGEKPPAWEKRYWLQETGAAT